MRGRDADASSRLDMIEAERMTELVGGHPGTLLRGDQLGFRAHRTEPYGGLPVPRPGRATESGDPRLHRLPEVDIDAPRAVKLRHERGEGGLPGLGADRTAARGQDVALVIAH